VSRVVVDLVLDLHWNASERRPTILHPDLRSVYGGERI
jgi:hypothetical protein